MKHVDYVGKTFVLACVCCLAAAVFGAKLSQSVPKGWGEDFALAKEEAAKDGRLILLAFSGSDWCGWCMKMEKEIYSDKKFISHAKKKFILLMIDNPNNKEILSKLAQKQNKDLTQKYGVRGFPSTVIVRASGEEVKRFGGYQKGGVDAFLEKLDAVAAEAAGKGDGGKAAAEDKKANAEDEAEAAAKDDRFFCGPAERMKIQTRETKQRRANMTNDFELVTFAGIQFGARKADGAPTLSEPYRLLSVVQKTSYSGGKLAGVTLAAPPKDVKAISAEDFRSETCKLVRAIESDLGIRFAVTGTKIDFTGKKTTIQVNANKGSGQLTVYLFKKK